MTPILFGDNKKIRRNWMRQKNALIELGTRCMPLGILIMEILMMIYVTYFNFDVIYAILKTATFTK